jgi:F0F1-type ATP synthase epsilon subunit
MLSYREDGNVVKLSLGAGFAEVHDNVMTVLAESGAPA